MPNDMGIGSVIGSVASSLIAKVMGGVILVLILFAGVQTWRLSNARSEAREAREEVGKVSERLATSNASIDALESIIAGYNAVREQEAKELERSRKLAEQERARFDKEAKANERRIDQLNEMAENLSSDCRVPPEMLAALKGL